MSLPALLLFEPFDLAFLREVSAEEISLVVTRSINHLQTDAVICVNIPSIDLFLVVYSALRARAISVAVEDASLQEQVVLFLARPEAEIILPHGFVSVSDWWADVQASIVPELPELSWAGEQLPKQVVDLDELDQGAGPAKERFGRFMRELVQLPPKRERVQLVGGESPAFAAVALDWFRPFLKEAWCNDTAIL